jgi:hypothetical protein
MGYTEPSIGNQTDPYRVINSRFQDETVTDAQKVNEYVSWYLNGLIGRAEYDPPNRITTQNIQSPTTTPPPANLRVLPLGDSITNGCWFKSYRPFLRQLIQGNAATQGYTFVGTRNDPSQGENCNASTYDGITCTNCHEGRGGFTSSMILNGFTGTIGNPPISHNYPGASTIAGTTDPDVVLLHVGTNDVFSNISADTTIQNIQNIASAFPNARVIVSQIIPYRNLDPVYQPGVDALNSRIANLTGSNIQVVNPRANPYNFNPTTDMLDLVHPNESGSSKIAQMFYDAIINTSPQIPSSGQQIVGGVDRVINFSGPLKRLLSWESQIVRRIQEVNKEAQGNIRHNQVVGCVDYNPFNFLGIVHCYPYGALVRPLVFNSSLSDFAGLNLPPLQRDFDPALLTFLWNTYWSIVTPTQPIPPLPSLITTSGYWLQYQVWRFTNPAISKLFSYIPFSSTENRVGQSRLDTYSVQPGGSSAVTILSSQITRQSPSYLYFSHMVESTELGELLQSLHSYQGAPLDAPADPAIAPNADYCDVREIRSNPGDSLFATNLTATIAYTAQLSCDFAIRDPALPGNLCTRLTNGSASCQPTPAPGTFCSANYGQVDCLAGQICASGCTQQRTGTCDLTPGRSCYTTSWGCT